MKFRIVLTCLVLGTSAMSDCASAADPSQVLVIHNKQFEPKQLNLPADVKLSL